MLIIRMQLGALLSHSTRDGRPYRDAFPRPVGAPPPAPAPPAAGAVADGGG